MSHRYILRLSTLLFTLALSSACGSADRKSDAPAPAVAPAPAASAKQPAEAAASVDLTGVWTRSDGVVFDAIDSGSLLTLARRLTEAEAFLERYQVELTRVAPGSLEGKARFRYRGESEEYTLGWRLSAEQPYLYRASCEAYEVKDGREVRLEVSYSFEVAAKNPAPAVVAVVAEPSSEASGEPAAAPASAEPAKDPAAVITEAKRLLPIYLGAGEGRVAAAGELLAMGPEIEGLLEDMNFDLEDDGERAALALLVAMRGQPAGFDTIIEILQDAASLDIGDSLRYERYYALALCRFMPVAGGELSDATKRAVLGDPQGSEADALAAAVKAFKAELVAIDWLKADALERRRIAQAVLLPGGIALDGAYGEYQGAPYAAEDEKAQRDAAADDFTEWFDAGVRPKLEGK
jgi:hypothetical protein